MRWIVCSSRRSLSERAEWLDEGNHRDGILLLPVFGELPVPLQRRAVRYVLKQMIGLEERINAAAVEEVIGMWESGKPIGGKVENIQGDIAVSANRYGVRMEPMSSFRARRKGNGNGRKVRE